MRILVKPDIHGDAAALEAAPADIQKQAADHIVCLGDAIQGSPQPAKMAGRMRRIAH